ncbi:hypothetical protein BDB00DRAFT_825913 [Zychaea mexicana]|uniref:uncharacterized protein n=1 Tax=Zychaea mexicana TaxID=64656 RepID=UPI0022FE904F|nr:uncharacterized protein BDB00DRAFT_825913 [Zychaea mexicana]KAI9492864.1 hypothetical protein BDB00DRAFT_825913 [Zychaea mexicana]
MSAAAGLEAGPSQREHRQPPSIALIKRWPDIALIIPNSGSMARDMLANERNFLTFFKLACTLVVLGFTVLLKFRLPDDHGSLPDEWADDSVTRPIGYTFIAIGFSALLTAVGKYFKTQRMLAKSINFIQAGWGSFIIVSLLFTLACVVMILASLNSSLFTIPS